jgi:hypothetical protein
MAVRILEDKDGYKALYCSTTMTAFGPIFYEDDDVEAFLEWLPKDARNYTDGELSDQYYQFRDELDKVEKEEEVQELGGDEDYGKER